MYSKEERQVALNLYFSTKTKPTIARFIKELGYPSDTLMSKWIKDDSRSSLDTRAKADSMSYKLHPQGHHFNKEERAFIIELFYSLKPRISPREFVKELGYPSKSSLIKWLGEDPRRDLDVCSYNSPSLETKLLAVKMREEGERKTVIMKKLGLKNSSCVYLWHKAWKEQGAIGLLPEKKVSYVNENTDKENRQSEQRQTGVPIKPVVLQAPLSPPVEVNDLPDDAESLKALVHELQLELAISKEVLAVLKVDPRLKAGAVTNKEKTTVVSNLEGRFPLKELLVKLDLKRSTYYYNLEVLTRPDKYFEQRKRIAFIFRQSNKTWGSKRIWATMKTGGDGLPPEKLSEKVVRRLMGEENCFVIYRKKRRRGYSSYVGEISAAPANIVNRNFHATKSNELWLTDITEFKLPNAPKVYLSVIIDCFDGKAIAWKYGLRPTKALANETLLSACEQKTEDEHPITHSDRGGHYRWPEWIRLCKEHGLKRSMSAKGCSPDNAAMEGFFGTLKNEFFYYRDWSDVTSQEFMNQLENYLRYHCEDRIKESLGWMSPNQYRESLANAA